MPDEKKGITVKIDADLHAEVRQYLESHEMTMAEFVTAALMDELHPKFQMKEDKEMGNMRTLAFQVPEDLFQKIKDYLQRNNMTQRQFVIGLIETELDRDLAQRRGVKEAQSESETMLDEADSQRETAPVSDFVGISDDAEEMDAADAPLDDEDPVEDASEDIVDDLAGEETEDEGMAFSMGM